MNSGSDGLMPARLALDTSAYSRFRAGDGRVHDLLSAAEAVIVPAIVLGELHGAFEFGARARVNRLTLAQFLTIGPSGRRPSGHRTISPSAHRIIARALAHNARTTFPVTPSRTSASVPLSRIGEESACANEEQMMQDHANVGASRYGEASPMIR